jgi:tyrosine-protein kinase Etk/Wzc
MSRDARAMLTPEIASPGRASPPAEAAERSLAEHLYFLFQARALVVATAAAAVVLGALYLAMVTPTYRSDVVVQVENSGKTLPGLSEVSHLIGSELPGEAEMEIIQSRSLLGSVVDELNLQVEAVPHRFPLLGALARRYHGTAPAPPFLGLASYAWGGERIAVDRLDVPDSLLNRTLTLVATPGGYVLRGPGGQQLLAGEVGKAANGRCAAGPVRTFVSDLSARPGTHFEVSKRARTRVIEQLQERLRVTEKGDGSGVLVMALRGADPQRLARVLDALAMNYVRENVEQKSAAASKTLDFLETQLPLLKANLDAAETARKGYQVQNGMVDLSREAQAMLDQSVSIERAISEAELQRAEVEQRFTGNHPAIIALNQKIKQLWGQRAALDAKMRDLPGAELESTRLTRDVKVASQLYDVLLNKAQELRVLKSGTIGNVRVLDRATVPDQPVLPRKGPELLVCLFLGMTGGVALAYARKSLYVGIDDPAAVEQLTGLTVYATVPRSAKQARLSPPGGKGAQALLAAVAPDDTAVEAICSLRTGLRFALLEASNNVVSVTGPTPEVGKSFVISNLAYLMARAERRVLLIDGDLRRGRIHKIFGGNRSPGLSDVLTGSASMADAVRTSQVDDLHWMSSGHIPPDPVGLLGSERFGGLVAELSALYDLVLIDTAPILPVTDAALVGRHAGTTLLVLRAGSHPAREVLSAVKRLAQNGVEVRGAVLNDLSGAGARYSRYGYQYRYDRRY